MKWFIPIPETVEELKKAYRKLAMKHHPDIGGCEADMKEINAEYEALFARVKDIHKNAKGETYTAKETTTETPEEFINIISRIINLAGITIEICGSWLWINGDTKPYKEIFKELKFRWSNNKRAWYWHKDGYRKRGKKSYSMNDIRLMWGSVQVVQESEKAIATA